jgi:hypothetical protein
MEDFDAIDTSSVEPTADELSDSEWIEIEEREWTNEQLLDDGRPGRRQGESNRVIDLGNIVNQVKELSSRSSSKGKTQCEALREKM